MIEEKVPNSSVGRWSEGSANKRGPGSDVSRNCRTNLVNPRAEGNRKDDLISKVALFRQVRKANLVREAQIANDEHGMLIFD